MFARLERYLMVMLVLLAMVVAVSPAIAQAQETAPARNNEGINTAESMVVGSGDSLWSISSERLGPNASPRQIARGAGQIYALNQDRIGGDASLILPGQKLSLPPMGQEPSRTMRGTAKAAEEVSAASGGDPGPEEALRTPRNTEADPVALPDVPPQQAAPEVGSPSAKEAPSPVESLVRTARSHFSSATSALFAQADRFGWRRLLGLGVIALTLLIAGLIARRMPLKRTVGGLEVWGIPTGYAGGYTPDSGTFGDEVPAIENGLNGSAGMIVAARRRREKALREQGRGSRLWASAGLATGAYSPRVTLHLRRARTSASLRIGARSSLARRQSLSPKGGWQ